MAREVRVICPKDTAPSSRRAWCRDALLPIPGPPEPGFSRLFQHGGRVAPSGSRGAIGVHPHRCRGSRGQGPLNALPPRTRRPGPARRHLLVGVLGVPCVRAFPPRLGGDRVQPFEERRRVRGAGGPRAALLVPSDVPRRRGAHRVRAPRGCEVPRRCRSALPIAAPWANGRVCDAAMRRVTGAPRTALGR